MMVFKELFVRVGEQGFSLSTEVEEWCKEALDKTQQKRAND